MTIKQTNIANFIGTWHKRWQKFYDYQKNCINNHASWKNRHLKR